MRHGGRSEAPFWLPRRYVTWVHSPQVGGFQTAVMPYWLATRHRQLVGNVAFERKRRERGVEFAKPIQIQSAKEATMATTKDMSGVLFKNVDKPEGRNRPDYSGDLLIAGMRYRIGGWVKESMRGKFLSLSIKKDEPAAEAKPAAKAAAYEPAADDSIPF